MAKPVYINGMGTVTAQGTHDPERLFGGPVLYDADAWHAIAPDYSKIIPGSEARRLSTGMKMSIAATKAAMEQAGVERVDAVITGTGMGCIRDSEKFLRAILDNDEQFLTPTPFIQSTHNSVAGHLACMLACTGYNFTYVHGSNSFASSVIDGRMQLRNGDAEVVLIGGVDELGDHSTELHRRNGHIKGKSVPSAGLLVSTTSGALFGEGAGFFVLGTVKGPATHAELLAVKAWHKTGAEGIEQHVLDFLRENGLSPGDVDAVVLGRNGDGDHDGYYNKLDQGLFKQHTQLAYKHRTGEFHTVPTFAMYLAARVLERGAVPPAYLLKNPPSGTIRTILQYDQYRSVDHNLTLLRKC